MKKYTTLAIFLFILFGKGNAQTINKELSKDNPLLNEQPSGHFDAEDVLNRKLQWKNPYPTKLTYDHSGFDKSKLGRIPGKGIHPRMFTSPSELENVKQRLSETRIGQMIMEKANKQITEIRIGKSQWSEMYQLLIHGEIEPKQASTLGWKFANLLTVQGLISQMNQDKDLLQETATVAANYLRSMAKYIEQTPIIEGLEDMPKEMTYWGGYLAKLYDFTATGMKNKDRLFFAQFIAQQSAGKYSVVM